MANVDRPHGFTVLGTLHGGPPSIRDYTVASANTLIGKGDLLAHTTAGTIDKASASSVLIIGVAMAPAAASSGATIPVCDDPLVILEAQTDDGTGTCTSLADMYGNVDFVAGTATHGMSRSEIDEDSQNTTATLPLKVIGLYPDPNNAFGEFNRLICIINNHVYKSVGVDALT